MPPQRRRSPAKRIRAVLSRWGLTTASAGGTISSAETVLCPDHLVVVRHHNGHAQLLWPRRTCSRAAMPLSQVSNGVNAVFLRLADDGLVDAVAIPDALRNLIVHMTAAPA